jgi:hypothetical protein
VPFYKLRFRFVLWQPPTSPSNPHPEWKLRKDLNV